MNNRDREVMALEKNGEECYKNRDYDQAILFFDKALEMTSDKGKGGRVNLSRGLAYFAKEEFDKAIKDFTTTIELETKSNKKIKKINERNREPGRSSFLGIIPEDTKLLTTAHYHRGLAYYQQGKDPQEGIFVFNKAEDNFKEAIKDFTEVVLSIGRMKKSALISRGNAYNKLGEFDKALADFNEVIKIDSKSVSAYNNRGISYYEQGEFAEATKDFKKVIELDSKNKIAMDYLKDLIKKPDELGGDMWRKPKKIAREEREKMEKNDAWYTPTSKK